MNDEAALWQYRRVLETTLRALTRELVRRLREGALSGARTAPEDLNRKATLRVRIRAALRRLEEGSFGVCLQCQRRIAIERLRAIPWTALCMHCEKHSLVSAHK